MTQARDLLIELCCEEIPAGVVERAAGALRDGLLAALDDADLAHGDACCFGTPRRIAVHVAAVATAQEDRVDEIVGPPARVAWDDEGALTRAGLGFAKKQGLDPAAVYRVETERGPYLAGKKQTLGQPTATLLANALPDLLRGLPWPKKMRWGREPEPCIRPVQGLVALLGDDVLGVSFAGVDAGRTTPGHRFLHPEPVTVSSDRSSYVAALRGAHVMVDIAERRDAIATGARQIAAQAGGTLVDDEDTLATVTQLVEWPFPLLGRFSDDFLAIPDAVIITTLREHQKLFTIRGPDGALLPNFVAVANTLTEARRDVIAHGNAKVVSARLSDARFFYDEDRKRPLQDYLSALDGQVYLAGLGTVRDRVSRLERLTAVLARELAPDAAATAERAATLCKADLATKMVFEFTELQGTIGEDYARHGGEPDGVAVAIREHYMPRFATDELPATAAGAVLALAERLDAIVGVFSLGLIPTGTQDPYALRRAALGALRIIEARGWSTPLGALVDRAIAGLPAGERSLAGDALRAEVLGFFRGRLRSTLTDDFATDLVEAVLDADFEVVPRIRQRLQALATRVDNATFGPLAAAFKRVGNIVRKAGDEADAAAFDPGAADSAAERALADAVDDAAVRVPAALAASDDDAALDVLEAMKPAVDRFFDDVMVMVEDDATRRSRLGLLARTAGVFTQIADFARIQAR